MEGSKNIVYVGLGLVAVGVLAFVALPVWVIRPLLYTVLSVGSLILVFLVLIQRGKGGGLAGALGGMGGYSAFGTRAGDLFTYVTIMVAALWILAAMGLASINLKGESKYTGAGREPAAGAKGPAASGEANDTPTSDADADRSTSSTGKDASSPGAGLGSGVRGEDKPSEKKGKSEDDL